jgi:hypothetical protein
MGIGKNKLYAVQVRVQSILWKAMHLHHGLHKNFPTSQDRMPTNGTAKKSQYCDNHCQPH